MKKRYNEEKTIRGIKQHEAAANVDICNNMGVSSGTFYNRTLTLKMPYNKVVSPI